MKETFISDLRDYLDLEQVSKMLVHSYLENCDEIEITKTDNRSVLSTQNEIMKVMKSLERRKIDEFSDGIRGITESFILQLIIKNLLRYLEGT